MDVGRSVLRLVFVAAGVLALAAACSDAPGVADAQGAPTTPATVASPSLPPSASPPGTAASTPRGRPSACHTTDMAVRLGNSDSAKFEEATVVELANTGKPCTVSGYLGLRFLDEHGAAMPTRVERFHQETPAKTFTVARGGRAYATLIWNKYEGEGTTCPPYPASLAVSLPGQAATVTAPWFIGISASACDGRLEVDALRPTRNTPPGN